MSNKSIKAGVSNLGKQDLVAEFRVPWRLVSDKKREFMVKSVSALKDMRIVDILYTFWPSSFKLCPDLGHVRKLLVS